MRILNLKLGAAALVAVAALAGTPQANASLDFTLNLGNSGLSGNPGPYGTVSITRVDSDDISVTLTALGLYSFGDGGTIGLNLAGGGTFTVPSISGTTLPGGSLPTYLVHSGNEDGFGNFTFQLDASDANAFKDSVTSLTFDVHSSAAVWATEADILSLNDKGSQVAGHVFVRNADGSNANVTGFATTPEPSTVIAGALLLLPFGASTLRVLRNRKA